MLFVLSLVLMLTLCINLYRKYVLKNAALTFSNRVKVIYLTTAIFVFITSYNQILFDYSYSPDSFYYLSLNFFDAIIELGVVYAHKFGLPLIFGPLGLVALFSKTKIRPGHVFLLWGLLFFVIFIFDTTYIINLQFFIILTICGIGFTFFLKNLSKSSNSAMPVLVLVLFLICSSLIPYFYGGSADYVDGYKSDERWDTGYYLKHHVKNEHYVLSSFGISASAVNALAEKPFWRDNEIDIIEDIVSSEITTENFFKSRSFYSTEIDYSPRQLYIENFDISSVQVQHKLGDVKVYLLVNNNFNEKSYSSPYESNLDEKPKTNKLVDTIINDSFIIYESENHSVFFVQ